VCVEFRRDAVVDEVTHVKVARVDVAVAVALNWILSHVNRRLAIDAHSSRSTHSTANCGEEVAQRHPSQSGHVDTISGHIGHLQICG